MRLRIVFSVLMTVILILTLVSEGSVKDIGTKACLSFPISYSEWVSSNNAVINVRITMYYINNTLVVSLTMSSKKNYTVRYTPPLMDFLVVLSNKSIIRWSKGKFFIQAIISKRLPISKTYTLRINGNACIEAIILYLKPLNYVRVVMAKPRPTNHVLGSTVVTPALVNKIRGLAKHVNINESIMRSKAIVCVTRTPTHTYKYEKAGSDISKATEATVATHTFRVKGNVSPVKEAALKTLNININIRAIAMSVVIALLASIIAYILIFRT